MVEQEVAKICENEVWESLGEDEEEWRRFFRRRALFRSVETTEEVRLRSEVNICDQQDGFMQRQRTADLCSEDVSAEDQRRSEGSGLCL